VTAPNTLNATQASLLGFLHDGSQTGWDLLQSVGSGLDRFWNITPSHVYRELKALEERNLVRAGTPGPRDRRPFTITRSGRNAFARWIREEPPHEQIRFPLLVTLWFGKHLDRATLARFLASHRAEHAQRLAYYREVSDAGAPDPNVDAVVAFGVRYEEAIVRWLDELITS
jgi:DNA-binding PadR family transcriptional regulator